MAPTDTTVQQGQGKDPSAGEEEPPAGPPKLIRDSAGLVLVVLIGVLNFVGLQGDEVKNVLRDEMDMAIIFAFLMFVALSLAVLSVFFGKRILTALLLLASLFVTGLASFFAIEVAAKLQGESTSPQVGTEILRSEGVDSLSLTVSASRLLRADLIGVTVLAVTRKQQADPSAEEDITGCNWNKPGPLGDQNPDCDFVIGALLRPAANGTVQQTLKVPFSADRYQYLRVIADLCSPVPETGAGQARQCVYDLTKGRTTTIDIRVPAPSPALSG